MPERLRHVSENYPLRTRELSLDDAPTEEVAACIDVWRRWCGGRPMPVWHNSDRLMALPHPVLPMTIVADVVGDPPDFVYRYWGSGFSQVHGYDLTGRSSRDITPEAFADIVTNSHLEVLRRGAPVLYVGETTTFSGLVIPECVLRLPFSDDGDGVDRVLTVVWFDIQDAAEWFGGVR